MVFLVIGGALAYWWFVWSAIIAWVFSHDFRCKPGKWLLTRAQRNVGLGVFISTAIIAGAVYLVLDASSVYQSKTQLQFLAIGSAVAITFGYGVALPPKVSLSTHRIIDVSSGIYDPKHLKELRVRRGAVTPIFLAVFNVGISTWTEYRVTLVVGDSFKIHEKHEDFPQAEAWSWGGGELTRRSDEILQASRSAPLAAGEPQISRFFVEAPHDAEDGEFRVVVACAGRFGETTSTIPICIC